MKHQSLSPLTPSLPFTIFIFFIKTSTISSGDSNYEACVPQNCGNQTIRYPFWIKNKQEPFCGFPGFELNCQNNNCPILQTPNNNYTIQEILYRGQTLRLSNTAVWNLKHDCWPPISNVSLEVDKFSVVSNGSDLYLLSNCSSLGENLLEYRIGCGEESRHGNGALAMFGNDGNLGYGLRSCQTEVLAPVELVSGDVIRDYLSVLRRGFLVKWKAPNCGRCEESGGRCGFDLATDHFKCFCTDRPHSVRCHRSGKSKLNLILGTVIPGGVVLVLSLLILTIGWRKKRNNVCYGISKNISSDLGRGSIYFGVAVFSYTELEEATNNFDASKELGDGGFGTVYHGILRDGREVAVKRLYEHNYKRVTQFMNEVEILTRLHHRNLVALYGCTSHQSKELLLVYEFIPNGTVADHLHGDRAKDALLTWPIRMSIAIETAGALAYLHASDIIHRDVKTHNILLDENFCVKVADFGLSRLFPTNVTHVSTAPQGTPGYVDPEYHQCYQLTDKSDVYSFGVVLIELISSMPAVDISRHRHEINLANWAINRIQNHAFNELIDPSLGFQSDSSIERMAQSVSEVAFRCLQLEKEMRPTMEEVLEALKEIQEYKEEKSEGEATGKRLHPSPESDHVVLLKNSKVPPSPDSVTGKFVSCSTTSFSSG
ncbi:LEAF RUST 10 DISEASE-RESISTANCE LOCUS RECEPTOR-LIKE PROTEIN KINASE-like 1.2 isoform X1 [Rhododendron vialii]|uniref:LEAF RUST 10 DISEASE-RESISTANCE LOCUS RECEPTOR-LIKE PROTEIN KINASE-like 1.2 isoform X1 n=1 Tax=Rhododendron vialii TaxID=182163 RepID=UPI00265EAEE0|nr:LEAF RUST 10 DISEASE-RESISTANCE LOCUS RECEPTOR-LIKE PROTEIN KINASE-like 1.2 isoform X1 [Rhododendron vialii]